MEHFYPDWYRYNIYHKHVYPEDAVRESYMSYQSIGSDCDSPDYANRYGKPEAGGYEFPARLFTQGW